MRSSTSSSAGWSAVLVAAALVFASCGSDSSSSDTTEAAELTVATTPPVVEDTTAVGDTTVAAETTVAATETTRAALFEGELVGTFSVDAAQCADGPVTAGSYFQMIQPGGTAQAGPFIPNGDSTCGDPSSSGLTPGTDGGLVTGGSQLPPDPAYDANGNGLAAAIFAPVTFFAVAFAGAMDPAGAAPSVTATEGVLSADLSAFTAYYGGASFNQGAPKPDGSGSAATGTIDPETGAYTLDWTSLIVGGSFDGFTGVWHLEGTFAPTG